MALFGFLWCRDFLQWGFGFKIREEEEEEEEEAMDRISELPEVIIQHILSFLNYKEAARSMVLSKVFLHAWSTRPFLDFDQIHFGIRGRHDPGLDTLLRFVDDTLDNYSRQRLSIQKFRLHISCIEDDKFVPFIEKWLPMVLQRDVAELDFTIRWKSSLVPPEIFVVKSLKVLKVDSSCIFEDTRLVLRNTDIMCRNLKKLQLEFVRLDDSTLRNLISCCSLIEELILKYFGVFKVCIANLPYLRVLELCYKGGYTIDIDAPMLESLTCDAWTPINIGESGNLKSLSLEKSKIVDEQLEDILFKNPFLEKLNLSLCCKLTRINFLGRSLEGVRRFLHVNLVKAMDAPNLHNRGAIGLPVTSLTPIISKLEIGSEFLGREIDASWFHDLRGFLTFSRKSSVNIFISDTINFDFEGFTAIPLPHGHEVEMLTLAHLPRVCLEHLDALLSLCHPKTVLFKYPDKVSNHASVDNFCKKLKSRTVPKCCNSDEMTKCWRHYIKDVKFDRVVLDEMQMPIRSTNGSFFSRFFKPKVPSTSVIYSYTEGTSFTFEWKCNE